MNDNRRNGFDKDRLLKQKRMENIEENLEQYKKHQQALKSDLAQLLIILKRNTTEENQKEILNARKNLLKKEIEMVGLMIDTYEFRIKVKKLDKEYKELVSRNLEGEFVDDLMKSNRFEVELLNKQDKENSDIIKELLMKLNEKKRKYQDDYGMSDREQMIKLMKEKESKIPGGLQKDKLIDVRKKFEINAKAMETINRTKNNLLEIVKNNEEYEALVKRKNDSESVENLINENRSYAELLAKKDREYSEEAKKWGESEEGKKWFEILAERNPKDTYSEMKNFYEYFLEPQKYKEGNYQFGNYSTKEQILEEFLKGKIFVLKGKFGVGSWIGTILMFAIAFISLFAILFSGPYGGLFIAPLITTFPIGVLVLLTIRRILVIGPLGIWYRNLIKIKTILWKNVSNIIGSIVTYLTQPIPTTAEVKVYLISPGPGKVYLPKPKKRFRSSHYRNKEFPKKKKLYREMFINLFYTYFSLGKNLDKMKIK